MALHLLPLAVSGALMFDGWVVSLLSNEQYLAGAILIDEKAIAAIAERVSAEDFESNTYRAIFEAAEAIHAEGGTIDPITIRDRARNSGADIPDDTIVQLIEITPTAANCEEYADRVADDSRKRKIRNLACTIELEHFSTSDELLEYLQKGLESIPSGSPGRKKGLSLISACDLQKANIPPVRFLVDELMPEGTNLIVAASKIGKSWMVLDMGLSIAAGTKFLGRNTHRCGVLYLALEDSNGRLQSRMNKVLQGATAPSGFYFLTEAPDLDNGLLEQLEYTLNSNPEIKLIIIDTLQKIRGKALPRESSYEMDYRHMGAVKTFAEKHGVSVLFVHHTRKMKDDGDPFNMISGTNGIMGAADTAWVIVKERSAQNATLHITGRDVAQEELVIRFDKENSWKWQTVGAASQIHEQQQRTEYEQNPIVLTVRQLLKESKDGQWSGYSTNLMNEGQRICKYPIAITPQKLGLAIKALSPLLKQYDNIVHETPSNGSAAKKHRFYMLPQWVSEVEALEDEDMLPL